MMMLMMIAKMRTFFIDSQIPFDYDDDVSLNDETFPNDFDNDIDLEAKTEYRMEFQRKIIQDDDDHMLLVNKMANILKRRMMWSRIKDGDISLEPAHMVICKEDLLTIVKEYIQKGIAP